MALQVFLSADPIGEGLGNLGKDEIRRLIGAEMLVIGKGGLPVGGELCRVGGKLLNEPNRVID